MKKNYYSPFMYVILFALISATFLSCSKDENEEEEQKNSFTVDSNIRALSSRLFNTSWVYQYTEFYNKSNGQYSHTNTEYANKFVFTFTDKIYSNNKFQLSVNGNTTYSYWWIDSNGLNYSAITYGQMIMNMSAYESGSWSTCGGSVSNGKIIMVTNSKLVVREYYSDGIKYYEHIYTPSNSSNDDSGSGTTTYEKPDIGFYDFTATKTSLSVQYQIFNKDEAKVTSAKVYYGTSSNPTSRVTATVSGTLITAKISGLKAGTTYYVKCSATGKGGTTTTSTTKCITNY